MGIKTIAVPIAMVGVLGLVAVAVVSERGGSDDEPFAAGSAVLAGEGADVDTVPLSYDGFAALLAERVDERGMVDYRALKAQPERLSAFVSDLAGLDRRRYDAWEKQDKLAFWINAYNALTLKAIIDNYPIKPTFLAKLRYPDNSIRQIKGVWKELEFPVMGRPITLDAIEHEVLRPQFKEPRIHLALVCAAMGCPPLRNEPFEGARLDEQFAAQASDFLGNSSKFRIDREGKVVHLSAIFDWFGSDFEGTYGTAGEFTDHGDAERAVLNYISRALSDEDRSFLRTGRYKIKYLDYDWSLNEQTPAE